MDIRRWLENTADRASPGADTNDPPIPEFLRPDRMQLDRAGRNYRHKRKRVSADSSIIAPRPVRHRNAHAPEPSPSPDHVREPEDAATGSESAASSYRSGHPSVPAKTYERRPRHKTRLDRYEPKAKKQTKERDVRKEAKSKRKRRKSHRSGDGGRTAGLVQSFQLKNGPKNSRLTLKPDTSAGLFKHGRAAMPVAARGSGLPDLVFNEMRFLQKPTEHQDQIQEAGELKKSNTKDRKRPPAEEISAYFTSNKATVPERNASTNRPLEESRNRNIVKTNSNDRRKAEQSNTLVKLPDKPFLGFGSKGAQQDSKDTRNKPTSYYTWSESKHPPSSPPCPQQLAAPTCDLGQLSAKRPKSNRRNLRNQHEGSGNIHQSSTHPRNNDAGKTSGEWIQTLRTRGPALVEIYQPPATAKHQAQHGRSPITKTTLQSLPKDPSSEIQVLRNALKNLANGRVENGEYLTSDILRMPRSNDEHLESAARPFQRTRRLPGSDKENQNPSSSLSIDRALGEAREALEKPVFVRRPPAHTEVAVSDRDPDISDTRQDPITRNAHGQRNTAQGQHNSLRQQRQGAPFGAYRHQSASHGSRAVSQAQRWVSSGIGTTGMRHPLPVNAHQFAAPLDDDEMLDNAIDVEPVQYANDYVYANNRQAEELVYRSTSIPRSGIYEDQMDRMEEDVPLEHSLDAAGSRYTPVLSGLSVDHGIYNEPAARPRSGGLDNLAGFWKPNKLY